MFQEAGGRGKYLSFKNWTPLYRLKFEDRDVVITSDHAAMRREIGHIAPAARKGFDRFLKRKNGATKNSTPAFNGTPTPGLFRKDLMMAAPALSIGRSLFPKFGALLSTRKTQTVVHFSGRIPGHVAWECPAITMLPHIEHAHGIEHVMGG
ncbi:MAG: hypothetical protein IPQ26_09615 [Elusimicrobia bacterium]|nr:hypothetical protein [Elusimicrobiota bacterium]